MNGDQGPAESSPPDSVLSFGPYRLDARRRELTRDRQPVQIQPKSFDLLLILARRAGGTVPTEDLYRLLWPNVSVSPGNLKQQIWMLRQVLGGESDDERYVEHVRGIGYRLAVPVTAEASGSAAARPAAAEGQREGARPRRRWIWVSAAAGCLFLTVAVVALVERIGHPGAPLTRPYSPSSARPAVAVIGFEDLRDGEDTAWLSVALSEMFVSELAAGGRFRVIPGEAVARAKSDEGITWVSSLAPETLARLRARLGVDLVVTGSYLRTEVGGLRIDLIVQEATSGDSVAAITHTGSESDLFDIVTIAGASLRSGLGVKVVTAGGAVQSSLREFPRDPRAAELYAEGLARLLAFDPRSAVERLKSAAALEPDSAVVHSGLAEAWHQLGYMNRSSEAARKAFELSTGLPEEAVLVAESRYWRALDARREAARSYGRLWQLFPTDIEHGLGLASVSSGTEALDTVAKLKKLPPPDRDDPRIDLEEARIATELADYKRALDAARRAIGAGERLGARLIGARGRMAEGAALDGLGDHAGAGTSYEAARASFADAGDVSNVAWSVFKHGESLSIRGRYDDALRMAKHALLDFRRVGNKFGAAAAWSGAARAYLEKGENASALRRYQIAAGYLEEIGDRKRAASMRGNIAIVLNRQGKLAEAALVIERSAAEQQALGFASAAANGLMNLGMLRLDQGELARAEQAARSSDSLIGGDEAYVRPALTELMADIAYVRGDLNRADALIREMFEQSRKWQRKLRLAQAEYYTARLLREGGATDDATRHLWAAEALFGEIGQANQQALCRLEFARGECASGAAAGGLAKARIALDTLRGNGETADAIQALAVCAECMAAAGDLRGGGDVAYEAWRGASESEAAQTRLIVAPAVAIVMASRGGRDEAIAMLRSNRDDADRRGYVPHRLEIELALGRLEIEAGDIVGGRRRLSAIAVESAKLGFNRIAGEARRYASSTKP